MASQKPVHTLVLDAGPLIKNIPSASSLLATGESLYTTPSVLSEIRDPATRSRVDTTLRPFLTVQTPKPASKATIAQFARKTGDYAVLSRQDLELLGLAYELECERNGGNWRLRSAPGQKKVNGSPPKKGDELDEEGVESVKGDQAEGQAAPTESSAAPEKSSVELSVRDESSTVAGGDEKPAGSSSPALRSAMEDRGLEKPVDDVDGKDQSPEEQHADSVAVVETSIQSMSMTSPGSDDSGLLDDTIRSMSHAEPNSDSDSDGWITPTNIKKHQAAEAAASSASSSEQKGIMQVATITTDFAMQNVLLQMNLNLLSPSLQRVRHLRTFILRCHACFATTKETTKQFCPRCGGPTLTRVSCSTDANGVFRLHLKKNMQWNTRGDKFSIPKPVPGAANGRMKGGGKGGWGNELILAEDQKEYSRALEEKRRDMRVQDLMDRDYLPGILTGERGRQGGRIKVGAGRNVNSKKRHK